MNRKPETVAFWWGRLPHWEVVDGRYFVTLHLAGAIPPQGQERIHKLAAELHRPTCDDGSKRLAVQRRVFAEMEAWLDRAAENRHLEDSRVAEAVMEAVAFRDGRDWRMFEFVVMPSHLHLFFELLRGDLKTVMEQFKRWTGHQAGKLLNLDGGRFWQDEWFDHWSRSDEEDDRIRSYIRRNPEKANLVAAYADWPYGSWRVPAVGAASRAAQPVGPASRAGQVADPASRTGQVGNATNSQVSVPLGSRDLQARGT